MPYANNFVFLMCFSGPRMNNSCSSSESTQRAQPIGVSTGQGNNSRALRVLPDFAQVYKFIGSVFDPKATGHLQKLKKMDPIDVETGGYVDLCRGVWRKQGSLAVSRGIGDRYLKQWVKAEPETEVLGIEPEHDLLILVCNMAQPLMACKKLVDLSVS